MTFRTDVWSGTGWSPVEVTPRVSSVAWWLRGDLEAKSFPMTEKRCSAEPDDPPARPHHRRALAEAQDEPHRQRGGRAGPSGLAAGP